MDRLRVLKDLGYSRNESQRILSALDTAEPVASHDESLFDRIISWASDCTGGNAAFSPEYGTHSMNELRRILGLREMSQQELKESGG